MPLASGARIDSLAAAYLQAARSRQPAHAEARQLYDALLNFDRAVNDAIRAGLVRNGSGQRFIQKTYSAGSDHLDLTTLSH